jgi:hypothetical protein
MRINYKYGIRTISGKLDGLVHTAWNKGRVAIARIFVMPRIVEAHLNFRDIKRNLATIWKELSVGFKQDLQTYTNRRIPFYTAEQIPAYVHYANYIKFIYAFAKDTPSIDLKDTTKEELELAGCPTSVADIVVAEYLPKIDQADDLINTW